MFTEHTTTDFSPKYLILNSIQTWSVHYQCLDETCEVAKDTTTWQLIQWSHIHRFHTSGHVIFLWVAGYIWPNQFTKHYNYDLHLERNFPLTYDICVGKTNFWKKKVSFQVVTKIPTMNIKNFNFLNLSDCGAKFIFANSNMTKVSLEILRTMIIIIIPALQTLITRQAWHLAPLVSEFILLFGVTTLVKMNMH